MKDKMQEFETPEISKSLGVPGCLRKLKPMASLSVLLLLCFLSFRSCSAADSITTTTFIKDPESLVSSNGTYKMSFFSPPNSTHRYVGIWYNKIPVMFVVWVANRNTPLTDSSGSFQISEDGNLQVLNGQKEILWSSSNVTQAANNVSKAQLLDSGNLVLLSSNNNTVWQSFDHPSDTILPHMGLIHHKDTLRTSFVQSWNSPSDPSQGRFVLDFGPSAVPEFYTWDNGRRYFRSGPWNGNMFLGIQVKFHDYQSLSIQNDGQGNITAVYSHPVDALSNYELTYQGILRQQYWDDATSNWEVLFQTPDNDCDLYGKCGEFGSCNSLSSPLCKCLKGFVPKNEEEWRKGNWSSGCTRVKALLCGIEGAKEDGFLMLPKMKVPADMIWLQGLDQDTCRSQCLTNCSCLAYAYDTGVGCMAWSGKLIDTQQFSTSGADIYLRLPHSELGSNNKTVKVIIGVTVVSGTATLAALVYIYYRRKTKQERNKTLLEILESNQSLDKFEELPLFTFANITAATNNFQESNKLGQGGFGPVYKGILADGQELAVKRLSVTSKQGVQEFMNEVLVISKLQHRNLVKLLGCCVERQERMLIYEYLPNKSLDAFLFDPKKKEVLDWKKRSTIIEGICRGLLYLHRDSRLKIIHRDLKAGNILLDENLNPKISDFGMARILGGDQSQADTTRVVGTYGYMPPEYAIEGRFSEKSDVFSFGVLLLEIITGKRTFWFNEESFNLLGYVWKMWSEDKVSSLIDPLVADQGFEAEISKFIHVGLLCVQEYAEDRPDISVVISMLSAVSTADFKQPKPPGFTRLLRASANTSSQSHKGSSGYDLTITSISGR